MKAIHNLHNFIEPLSKDVLTKLDQCSFERSINSKEAVYRQGDDSIEVYQLQTGGIKLCNYSHDGKEVVMSVLKPGDCFGEMGVIDKLPRLSHAIAIETSTLRVLSEKDFNRLYNAYPEISRQINLMLCLRMRALYSLTEDANALNLHQRLARTIHRLSYSHGKEDGDLIYIDICQEELAQLLCTSRQSISKELKNLKREGSVEVRYGKIYLSDIESLSRKYENLMGQEQLTPIYHK